MFFLQYNKLLWEIRHCLREHSEISSSPLHVRLDQEEEDGDAAEAEDRQEEPPDPDHGGDDENGHDVFLAEVTSISLSSSGSSWAPSRAPPPEQVSFQPITTMFVQALVFPTFPPSNCLYLLRTTQHMSTKRQLNLNIFAFGMLSKVFKNKAN